MKKVVFLFFAILFIAPWCMSFNYTKGEVSKSKHSIVLEKNQNSVIVEKIFYLENVLPIIMLSTIALIIVFVTLIIRTSSENPIELERMICALTAFAIIIIFVSSSVVSVVSISEDTVIICSDSLFQSVTSFFVAMLCFLVSTVSYIAESRRGNVMFNSNAYVIIAIFADLSLLFCFLSILLRYNL